MFKRYRQREAARRVLNLETDAPAEYNLYVALGLTRLLAEEEPVTAHGTEPILLAAIERARNERLHRATWGETDG